MRQGPCTRRERCPQWQARHPAPAPPAAVEKLAPELAGRQHQVRPVPFPAEPLDLGVGSSRAGHGLDHILLNCKDTRGG